MHAGISRRKPVVTSSIHRGPSWELTSTAREDIDLEAGTITIRRNYTKLGEFTLPKTEASTNRVIHLIQPAISVLRNQAEMTVFGKSIKSMFSCANTAELRATSVHLFSTLNWSEDVSRWGSSTKSTR